VLVALLLLAVTLMGACAMLVQTMRATHGALLATRAVDLAADLTEELHNVTSVTQAEAAIAAWRARIGEVLPVAGLEPDEVAALEPTRRNTAEADGPVRYELTLRWRDARRGLRELRLPVAATFDGPWA
jgi:hypothetical protein